jgi:hypothetical protein
MLREAFNSTKPKRRYMMVLSLCVSEVLASSILFLCRQLSPAFSVDSHPYSELMKRDAAKTHWGVEVQVHDLRPDAGWRRWSVSPPRGEEPEAIADDCFTRHTVENAKKIMLPLPGIESVLSKP